MCTKLQRFQTGSKSSELSTESCLLNAADVQSLDAASHISCKTIRFADIRTVDSRQGQGEDSFSQERVFHSI
jgi:hypothetical protein